MIKGYDVFYEVPGQVAERTCLICGTICIVERNRLAATSWTESMAKRKSLHDFLRCPNTGEAWYDRATDLVERIEGTPSDRVSALMRQDLDELLVKHGCKLDQIDRQ